MKTNILRQYGLNRNDIKAYETLITLGQSKTGALIKTSGIASSRVYESLRILVARGLVSYQVKNNIKYYKAESPEQLVHEAGKNITELKSLAEEIASATVSVPSRNEANIYEGRHGFKMAFTQHMDRIKKGEKVSIIGFSRSSFTGSGTRELRTFFRNLDVAMMPKKCDARLLCRKDMREILELDRIDPSIYKLKFLPSAYFSPCAVNISETEVLLSMWGDHPIVFSIKNPTIIKSFQKNFDFLWSMAKE